MKKYLVMAFAALGLMATSCSDDPVNTTTMGVVTYNYVTNLNDDSKNPVIKPGTYSFEFDLASNNMTLSTNNLDLGSNQVTSFTVEPAVPFKVALASFEGSYGNVFYGNAAGPYLAKNGMEVKNLAFELSPVYYVPPMLAFDSEANKEYGNINLDYIARSGVAPKMRYLLGSDYLIYTFWPDLYYTGKTTTSVNGASGSDFESLNVGFRIKFDLDTKKALVVMHNAQFNPNMPEMKALILTDLDVDFTNNGYEINAENVIPFNLEGGKLTPYPNFPFTTFSFKAEGDMVNGSCDFTVAGRFTGHFDGKYMEYMVK